MERVLPIKLILIGDSSVGKTCLLKRFATGVYRVEESTIDHAFEKVFVQVDGLKVELRIHDTAGTERYKSMTRSYYRRADGVILVYDVTRIETFSALSGWLDEIKSYCEDDIPVLIVGNKIDDESKKAVTERTVKSFARQNNHIYMEASALENINVESVFFSILKLILRKDNLLNPDSDARMEIVPSQEENEQGLRDHEFSSLPPKLSRSVVDNISIRLFHKKASGGNTIHLHSASTQTEGEESKSGGCAC